MSNNRFNSIDLLRGIAALMVTMFHLSNGNSSFLKNTFWFKQIFSNCWSGVEMFFVISGFIIPFSMMKKNYELSKSGIFLLKRIIRIDPPYFISILIVVGLNYFSTLSPLYKGQPFVFDYKDGLLHLGYLSAFFNKPWINPVYWTLAIEFQYYILIALIFPLISNKNLFSFLAVTIIFLILSYFFRQSFLVFKYLPYFLLGIVVFKSKINQINNIFTVILLTLFLYYIIIFDGKIQMWVSFFAVIMILYGNSINNKFLSFFGSISYSLYLLHIPIGGRIINLSMNYFHTDYSRLLIVLIALLSSSFFAYLYFLIVEKPFLNLSSKISI